MRRRLAREPAGSLVEVALEDDGRPGSSAAGGLPPAPAGGDRPTLGRRLRPVVVLLVVVVLVGGVATWIEGRRDVDRRLSLAWVPGILAPLDRPLVPVWQSPGESLGGTRDAALTRSSNGAIRALDPTTGTLLWERGAGAGATQEHCQPVGVAAVESNARRLRAPAPEVDGPELLACASTAWTGIAETVSFGPVHAEIIDAGTGDVVATLSSSGVLVLVEPVEQDVVLGVATPSGHLELTRWAPATAELISENTSTVAIFPPGTVDLGRWERLGGTLVVTEEGAAAFSLTDGTQLPVEDGGDAERPPPQVEALLPDGGRAGWSHRAHSGEVRNADGSIRFELPGPPLRPWTSDGSAPDVLVGYDGPAGQAVGFDMRTGAELWRSDLPWVQTLVQIDGVLVVNVGNEVRALDVLDGSTRWSTESTGFYDGMTDGEVVLVVQPGARGGELVAIGIADGAVHWRSPLPGEPDVIQVRPGGTVIMVAGDGVIGLG